MISNPLPEELFTEDIFTPIRSRIIYFTRKIDNYHCHIFSVKLKDTKELKFYWETFSSIVASNFQSQLEEDIELWNIYIIFIVNDKLTKEVKYKIEQDKYSSRKIVFDHKIYEIVSENENELPRLIENKIFSLQSKVNKNEDYGSSENLIKNFDFNLHTSLNNYLAGNKIEHFYNLYFKLKHGE